MRCCAIFPIEHPLELNKVAAQRSPHLSSWAVAKSIFRAHGLMGFTQTAQTNFPRRVAKETLRWPAIAYAHEFLIQTDPNHFSREGINSKVVTGALVALFDSLVVLPFDRLIAYQVQEEAGIRGFFRHRFVQEGMPSLYRGFSANLIRQGVMWMTVIPLNTYVKKKFDTYDTTHSHPYIKQAITSVAIASACCGMILPFDFVKVRIQMDPILQRQSLYRAVKLLRMQFRIPQFYAGSLPVFIHTIFHATLGGYILDRLFSEGK